MKSNESSALGGLVIVGIIAVLIYLLFSFIDTPKPEIVEIDGCKYERYNSYENYSLVHLESCDNKKHY